MTLKQYSINNVPRGDRFEFWHQLVCTHPLDKHTTLIPSGSSNSMSRGMIAVSDFQRLKLMRVETSAYTVKRGRTSVSRATDEFAEVVYQRKGKAIFQQASRTVTMTPGCFTLYDSTLPHQLDVTEDCDHLIARIPRAQLIQKIPRLSSLIARPMDGRTGVGQVVVQLLNILSQEDASHCSEPTWHTIDAILDSTAAAVSATYPQRDGEHSSSKQALLQRIKLYVDNNLTSESLTPTQIAKAHGISVRYLNTLLEYEDTSITRWIRARRLERCATDLTLPSNSHRSIGEIAYGWGFNSLSYFNREFKSHYNVTPREYRASQLLMNANSSIIDNQ